MDMRQLAKDVFAAVENGSQYGESGDIEGLSKAFYEAVANIEAKYGLFNEEASSILVRTGEKITSYELATNKKFTPETFAAFIDNKTDKEIQIFYAM